MTEDLVLELVRRLSDEYGIPTVRRLDPLEEIILTILSQNTNDVNRDKAWKVLRERFPAWEDVLSAPSAEIADAIRIGGLAHTKAGYIKGLLQRIKEESDSLSMDYLKDMDIDEAMEHLRSFNGVGPKTASIVLLFSLGMPAFPVDTHIHRVARRLGLITGKTTREQAHVILSQTVPEDRYMDFHINLITHGRKVCTARNPACGECFIYDICPTGRQLVGAKLF